MGIARKDIITDESLMHITFRTHNRQFYFDKIGIKEKMILIFKKYKAKYDISIFDWVIMSNHCHFSAFTKDAVSLSNFMRSANKAIADLVNKEFKKSGQAIQDRFKSPVIEDESYAINTIGYIWLNPARANLVTIQKAEDYKYGSLYYKFRGLADPIGDSLSELEKLTQFKILKKRSVQRFTLDLLNELKSKWLTKLTELCREIYEHSHSIGSPDYIGLRSEKIKAPPS